MLTICLECNKVMVQIKTGSNIVFLNRDNLPERIVSCDVRQCLGCGKQITSGLAANYWTSRKEDPTINNLVDLLEKRGLIAAKIKL